MRGSKLWCPQPGEGAGGVTSDKAQGMQGTFPRDGGGGNGPAPTTHNTMLRSFQQRPPSRQKASEPV